MLWKKLELHEELVLLALDLGGDTFSARAANVDKGVTMLGL